jgi:hypothetical protein
MYKLLTGETLRVCWQHPPEPGATGDTEHILIVREAENVNNQNNASMDNNIINQENQENINRNLNYINEFTVS